MHRALGSQSCVPIVHSSMSAECIARIERRHCDRVVQEAWFGGTWVGGEWRALHSFLVPKVPALHTISLGLVVYCANSVDFQGLVPLLPEFCQLSVPEVGVCGVY